MSRFFIFLNFPRFPDSLNSPQVFDCLSSEMDFQGCFIKVKYLLQTQKPDFYSKIHKLTKIAKFLPILEPKVFLNLKTFLSFRI